MVNPFSNEFAKAEEKRRQEKMAADKKKLTIKQERAKKAMAAVMADLTQQGEHGEKGDQGERGEKGDKGDVGDRGPIGMQGARGIQGVQGDKGEKGDRGSQGITGPAGMSGVSGRDGKDGVFTGTFKLEDNVLTLAYPDGEEIELGKFDIEQRVIYAGSGATHAISRKASDLLDHVIKSDIINTPNAVSIGNMIYMSAADYLAITPDPNVFYLVPA